MAKEKIKQLSNEELAFFADQTALMLDSGIPLYESMEVLSENYADTPHAAAFSGIYEATERGSNLAEAMQSSGLFPQYAVKMTEIGESTGKLDQVLRGLARHYAREHRLKISVRNTVRYPLALLCIMAVVVLILVVKVLPVFKRIMLNLGSDSLRLTQITMTFGKVAGITALVLVLLTTISVIMLTVVIKAGNRDKATEVISKFVPAYGKLEKAIAAERFLSVLSISLQAGYPPENAIESCMELIKSGNALRQIKAIAKVNDETGSMSDAICDSGFLDPLKARMVKIGFMTGRQDEVTAKVAEMYSAETDEKLEKLLSIIEPTLIAILAVIIGCVLLAIMLPLAGIMSSML